MARVLLANTQEIEVPQYPWTYWPCGVKETATVHDEYILGVVYKDEFNPR
jgi:hypothetical protein